jgi:DNA-directed RNA polymerase I, II, and III subunit RPABC5
MSGAIPIRCFTCSKVVGNKWEHYISLLEQGKTESQALDELGLRRYCCRRMLLTHIALDPPVRPEREPAPAR